LVYSLNAKIVDGKARAYRVIGHRSKPVTRVIRHGDSLRTGSQGMCPAAEAGRSCSTI